MAPKRKQPRTRTTREDGSPRKKVTKTKSKKLKVEVLPGWARDSFPDSRFVLQQVLPAGVTLGNLNNPIHAIFGQQNFPAARVNYAVLQPSLRLASHLIASEASTRHFHIMLNHGDSKYLEWDELMEADMNVYSNQACKPRALTKRDRETVSATLAELHMYTSFPVHKDQPWLDAKTSLAKKNATLPGEWARHRRNRSRKLSKLRTQITFGRGLYDKLVEATTLPAAEQDKPLLLVLRFLLAVLLAHEVCHALRYAFDGDLHMDPFLGNKVALSERGFEWENALFGGRFQILYGDYDVGSEDDGVIRVHQEKKRSTHLSELVGIPVLWNWPDRMITISYQKQKLGMWRRNDWDERMPMKDVAWRIAVADIAKLFTEAFWRGIPAGNPSALHFTKSIGRVFKADGDGEPVPSQWSESERKLYVPEYYRVTPAGDIR